MLYFNTINIIEGIDVAESNNSKGCIVCHYRCFNHWFNFQSFVSNGCHDLAMFYFDINSISTITVKNVDYRCIYFTILAKLNY